MDNKRKLPPAEFKCEREDVQVWTRVKKKKKKRIDLHPVTRKYDALIHSLGCGERKQHVESSVDYSSNQERKIEAVERPFLYNSPLLALGDMVMREPHSLLAMYASTERGRQRGIKEYSEV